MVLEQIVQIDQRLEQRSRAGRRLVTAPMRRPPALPPMIASGGCVLALDHRIPNGTPLENYRYYVRTAREILGLEPDPAPGWARAGRGGRARGSAD